MAEDNKKPDEKAQVDTPQAVVAKEEKKPEDKKFEESPEDIKKSREFHQREAQEAKDQLKEKDTEIDQIYANLDAADPAGRQIGVPPVEKPPPETTPVTTSPEPIPVDELGQPDVAAIVRQAVRQEVGKMRDDLSEDFQQKQERIQQEQDQRDWNAEKGRAIKAAKAHQKAYNISDEVFNACDTEASEVVGPPQFLGAYTRWAKVMRRLIDQHQLQSSITQKATTAEANAAAQIEHAGKVEQPVGSAISPPEAGSFEKWNRQQADDIAEDDPPVG